MMEELGEGRQGESQAQTIYAEDRESKSIFKERNN